MPDTTTIAPPAALIVRPAARLVIREAEGGGFWCEFPAFPGVYAEGETLEELHLHAEAILSDYFERRGSRASQAAREGLSDDRGSIPVIPSGPDSLGVWMPLPARVEAARHRAAERSRVVLDRMPDDPPEVTEAFFQAIGIDPDSGTGEGES